MHDTKGRPDGARIANKEHARRWCPTHVISRFRMPVKYMPSNRWLTQLVYRNVYRRGKELDRGNSGLI